MKVTLLLTQSPSALLDKSIQLVTKVLQELEVEIHGVQVHKLPYFDGKKSRQMDSVMSSINASDGVIAISSVPMLGIHGALQSFFDSATLYEMEYFNKPILAITCSKWLGEQEAVQMIQKCWNILGGVDGGSIAMNEALPHEPYLQRIEKEVENFYRLMRQERPNIGSSERLFYYNIKQGGGVLNTPQYQSKQETVRQPEIKSLVDMIKSDNFATRMERHTEVLQSAPKTVPEEFVEEIETHHINLSTKEQTIKEIANLIEREANGETFTSMQAGIYTRPPQMSTGVSGPKKLQQIPHYFVAQHDKTINVVIKYQLTDLNENGYIVISNGDCDYRDEVEETPHVEMMLSEDVLQEILNKKITYQKAFMLGKLKVKGNFAILPKLDQVFKAL